MNQAELASRHRAVRDRRMRLPFAVYRCLNQLILVDEPYLQTSDDVVDSLQDFLSFFKTVYDNVNDYPEAFLEEEIPKIIERDVLELFSNVERDALRQVVSRSVRPDAHYAKHLAIRMLWRGVREVGGHKALPPLDVTSHVVRWELQSEKLREACRMKNARRVRSILASEDPSTIKALGMPWKSDTQWSWATDLFDLCSPGFAPDSESQAALILQGAEIVTSLLKFVDLDPDAPSPTGSRVRSRPSSPVPFRLPQLSYRAVDVSSDEEGGSTAIPVEASLLDPTHGNILKVLESSGSVITRSDSWKHSESFRI